MLKRVGKLLLTFVAAGLALEVLAVPQAQLQVSRTSGVAPLAVHFDATGTTDTDNAIDPFRQLQYSFNFGDSGSGTWAHTGLSKNTQVGGPVAGHVFDQPGTYTVTLVVRDSQGRSDTEQATITVQDPNSVFAGTNTVCISRNTDTSSCPSGAQRLTNASSWPTFESGKRYLIKAGQDFRSLGNISVGQVNGMQLASFGSGAKPIVGYVQLQWTTANWTGSWIENVQVIGLSTAGIGNGITGRELLIYRNDVHATNVRISLADAYDFYRSNGYYDGRLITAKNLFVVENTNTQSGGWATGQGQMVWMGNHFKNSQEHNIRLWQVHKTFVGHNLLEGGAVAPGRSNLKIHSTGLTPATIDAAVPRNELASSRYVVVANNIFNATDDRGVWNTVAYAPQNNESAEGCEDGIFENNTHIRGAWPGHWQTGLFGGRNITQRGAIVRNSYNGDRTNSATGSDLSRVPSAWDGPYFINDDMPGVAVSPPLPPTLSITAN